jgi:hypothetical protein
MSLQIQLKKSAVSQKQPFASDLAIGELALNYNANGPFLTCKDSAGNVRKLNNVWVATAAPNNPSAGDLWLDTSAATAVLKVYKSSVSSWVNATTIPVATTSIFGSVQLASAADITNGTAGKVVDAAQLQSKMSAELSANPITFQGVNVVNNVTIGGNLTVNGTQTIINTTTLDVEDKNIVIGNVATPTNTTADGGGISLLGATTKTLNWVNATGAWTSSENVDLASGKSYRINGTEVLSATALTVPLGSAAAPTVRFSGDANSGLYSPGADQVAVATNGVGRLFVDASGNVAIIQSPITVPSYTKSFNVSGLNASIALRANSTGTYSDQGIFFAVDGINYSHIYNEGVGQLVFRTGSSLSERLRITSAGNVGIGTTTPVNNLDVFSASTTQIGVSTNNSAAIAGLIVNQLGSGASTFIVRAGSNYTILGSTTNTPVLFSSNNLERMRIDSSGRLLVGTSADSGGALLQVNGDRIRVATAKTPASATATGTAGEICWDASYIYVCTATNTWKRTAISTW